MSSSFTATDADGYELMMGRWSRLLADPFIEFSGLIQAGRILDVGCGTGSFERIALTKPGQASIVGIDISKAFVSNARATVKNPRAVFEVCDATALPFPDASFDQTVSMLVLNFVPECMTAIGEISRVTRPGGTVAAAVWNFEGGLVMNRIIWDAAAILDPEASVMRGKAWSAPLIREGELAQSFSDVGMVEIVQRDLLIWMRYASFSDYWGSYLSAQGQLAAYVGNMTEERRKRLEAVVYDAYCAGRADGPRAFAAVAHAARGRVPN